MNSFTRQNSKVLLMISLKTFIKKDSYNNDFYNLRFNFTNKTY